MLIKDTLQKSQAFIAAWLPGTIGGSAISNGISGKYIFRNRDRVNTLATDWLLETESLADFPIYEPNSDVPQLKRTLFKKGFGIKTTPRDKYEKKQEF